MATKKASTKKAGGDEENEVATSEQEEVGTKGPSNEPDNKMSDIKDNSVDAAELSKLRKGDDKGAKLAAADADTAERLKEETEKEKREEDMSVHARLSRSGYVYNEIQGGTGERWIGESAANDPDLIKHHRVRVTNIAEIAPRKGMTVKPLGGDDPFVLGDEYDRDSKPDQWLGVINPATKRPLIEA